MASLRQTIQAPHAAFQNLESVLGGCFYKPDFQATRIMLGAIQAHYLNAGDPTWLFLVAPPSTGKTTMSIMAAAALPQIIPLSDFTESTFLSGLTGKEQPGILEKLGRPTRNGDTFTTQGDAIFLVKDFTTVLSMRREKRGMILAQLREIHDGAFKRDFGTGESKIWRGHVRRVVLPPLVIAARMQSSSAATPETEGMPLRQSGRVYPKVGIIDGGVGAPLNPWKLGSHSIVSPEHQQLDHGSFIAGLLVAGQQMNGTAVCNEADGCDLFDIGVLPDSDQQLVFETYYPKGVVDFLEELDAGVEIARSDHGIRIFNMSLTLMEPVESDSYGVVASLIDRIADKHDVVFVVSAGNLRPAECRAEWSADPNGAAPGRRRYLVHRAVAWARITCNHTHLPGCELGAQRTNPCQDGNLGRNKNRALLSGRPCLEVPEEPVNGPRTMPSRLTGNPSPQRVSHWDSA